MGYKRNSKVTKSKQKIKKISGGKRQVLTIGLIRINWFGGVCMWDGCEKTFGLEFAHAIPTELSRTKTTERSSYERLQDLMNNPECFLLYCPPHHREFDGRTSNQTWRNNYEKR